MWHRVEDAAMRLSGCIVRYDDEPVYIHSINQSEVKGIYATASFLGEEDTFKRTLTNPVWDFSPVPTGYMNYAGNTFFITRVPIRKWKQGLHADNVISLPNTRGLMGLVKTKEFRCVVKNVYPTVEYAHKMIKLGHNGYAFHRKFALTKNKYAKEVPLLMYMGEPVGIWEDEGPVLTSNFQFLNEELQEAVA